MLSFEEKIKKAKERKEERSNDLQRKYDQVKSKFVNIYGESIGNILSIAQDPRFKNYEKVIFAIKIKDQFEKAEEENKKIYDEEVEEAKREEKASIDEILDDLTDDWEIDDEDDEDWFDEDDDEDKALEAI